MSRFWQFARMMLDYRRLLTFAAAGALLDALCVLGGFGTLTWIISQFFNQEMTIQQIVREKLASDRLERYVGDLTFIADYLPSGQFAGLGFVLGLIVVLGVVGSAGRFMHQYGVITITLRTVMRIRKRLFGRLVHLPMSIAGTEGMTAQFTKIVRDCQVLASGFNALTSRAVRGVLIGTVLLGYACFLDFSLTMIFLLIIPPVAILIRKFGKRVRRASHGAMQQYSHMLSAIAESLQALPVVKVHHTEGFERRRFNRINRRALGQEMRARTARALSGPVIEMAGMVGVVVVVLIAAWSVFQAGRSPEELVSVLLALAGSAMHFKTLAGLNNRLQESAAAAGRIDEVLTMPAEAAAREEQGHALTRLPRHRRSIVFDGVWFRYPGAIEPALREINLTVPHGTVCAVVGGNGSGKSTLLGLLPRLYEPEAGRVLVDGHDIAGCTLRSLRRQMALVSQDTVLFDGTVAENIAYGSRHANRDRILEASRLAHADQFIEELPEGYETQVGERGQRLSGGQRQRIAIARAILRNPSILILDEATSQVDGDSEAKIHEELAEFMAERTTFLIAHRLSTVVHADMIAVLEHGSLVAVGTHRELLESSDAYRVLCRTQLQGLPQGE